MPAQVCAEHQKVAGNLDSIVCAVKRLEENQTKTSEIQIEMSQSLAVMASTLAKIEDSNIVLTRIMGRVDNVFALLETNEKEHGGMFTRIRKLEDVRADARLASIEKHQGCCQAVLDVKGQLNKVLWGGLVSVVLALVATISKAVWK